MIKCYQRNILTRLRLSRWFVLTSKFVLEILIWGFNVILLLQHKEGLGIKFPKPFFVTVFYMFLHNITTTVTWCTKA